MINSKTALNKMYHDIAQPIADPDTYSIGYGFRQTEFIRWMKREGFRTDTARCPAVRWMETWIDCGLLIKVKGDQPGNATYWFTSVDVKTKAYVGADATTKVLNNVYDQIGEYNPKMRTGGA